MGKRILFRIMKEFSLLIKPSSADCNMNCHYCYYLEKSSLYPENNIHRMTKSTLERIVSSYMRTPQPCYTFGWQGGEPTIMGLDFFKTVVELQRRYGKPGSLVLNGLQTNATLIDEKLAKHLAEYKFLVGVSLDGPEYIHNHYRKLLNGQGTFKRVMEGIETLRKNNVEFNILVLVNDFNVTKAEQIYRFLVKNGFYYHQYIPCVEFDSKGNLKPYSINGDQWGNFLIQIFDLWYTWDMYKVSIRFFDSILNKLVNGKETICPMGNECNHYFVVEYNGDIYPCDFYVQRNLKLGNILTHSFEELLNSPLFKNFGKSKLEFNNQCSKCDYLELCFGDCLKYRNFKNKSSKNLSLLCSGWKMFFNHSIYYFKKITQQL